MARGADGAPMAVVVSRPGSAVQTERDVLGNTRLDVVCPKARAEGVRAGQTVAAARAKCAELRVKVVGEQAVRGALVRIAESMLVFGPTVSFDPSGDVVWVDVAGCAHLHGGELDLARSMGESVARQGHACRVAIAAGPRIAAAVARWGSRYSGRSGEGRDDASERPFIVPEGKEAAALRVLPVAALGLDEGVQSWLASLGLKSCGDLQKLPRRSLGTRLGPRAYDVMQLLDGDDSAPLVAWRPHPTPEESIELEWGAHSVEGLTFVMSTLCERLAARLEGRAMAAGRLEIDLELDRALCSAEGRDAAPPLSSITLVSPVPMSRARDLFAVVRTRLERHTLAAPVLRASLRACDLAAATPRTRDLLSPEPKAERSLPPLVAELVAELGVDRVGTLTLVDTWEPSERTRLLPFNVQPRHSAAAAAPYHAIETSALEPSRLLPPLRVPCEAVSEPVLLARVEAVEWWRRPTARRDLVAAWWSGALGWFEVEPQSRGRGGETRQATRYELRGWVD
jgi:protein ImuB